MGEVTDGGDLASRVERPGAGVRGGERYGGGRKGRENGRLPVSPLTTMGRRGGHQKETAAGKRVPRPQEVRTDRKAAAETARGDAGERAEPRPQRPPTRGHTGCRQEGPTLGGDAVRHSGPRRSGSKQTRRPPPPGAPPRQGSDGRVTLAAAPPPHHPHARWQRRRGGPANYAAVMAGSNVGGTRRSPPHHDADREARPWAPARPACRRRLPTAAAACASVAARSDEATTSLPQAGSPWKLERGRRD